MNRSRVWKAAIRQVKFDIDHLVDFAVAYYENLLKKYGKGKERKTEIRLFDTIQAKTVAIAEYQDICEFLRWFYWYGIKER
jgi:topoisomerase-4 subunit A